MATIRTIRDNQSGQTRVIDCVNRWSAQNAMSSNSVYFLSSVVFHGLCGFCELFRQLIRFQSSIKTIRC